MSQHRQHLPLYVLAGASVLAGAIIAGVPAASLLAFAAPGRLPADDGLHDEGHARRFQRTAPAGPPRRAAGRDPPGQGPAITCPADPARRIPYAGAYAAGAAGSSAAVPSAGPQFLQGGTSVAARRHAAFPSPLGGARVIRLPAVSARNAARPLPPLPGRGISGMWTLTGGARVE